MILFLDKMDFIKIYKQDTSFGYYFREILKKEYKYRYNNTNIPIYKIYENNLKEFTSEEKYLILSLVKSFTNKQNWFFFKFNRRIDKGMPFTLSNYIFLPDDITSYNHHDIRDILIHEQVHIHQHNNIVNYNEFYRKCGFDKINEEMKVFLKNKFNILTNPDSLDIYIYKKKYIPLIIITGNSHETSLYDVETSQFVSIDLFKKIFHIQDNLSSPHEIFAELFVQKYNNI
tara:strand:- start:162 stop:851 length:690 start_codon:yes stop_codon:yes gene_type:complete